MKNILFPTDFSENSWNALAYALPFFEKKRCNFYLLNVCRPPAYISGDMPYAPASDIVEKTVISPARTEMDKLLKRINKLSYNVKHNFVRLIEYNFLIDAVKNTVEEKDIDLIVMGTKGASGLKGKILGSNTGDVITRIQCPTLIIPEKAQYTKPKEIAFPTDYNLLYNIRILDNLLETGNAFDAAIRVLYVAKKDEKLNTEQQENKELLQGYLKGLEHSFHQLTNNNLEDAIQCFTESRGIDMIVMVAKNLNYFQQIFFKPTVEEISYHTEIPFLVLHE